MLKRSNKRKKRPQDVSQLAKSVVDEATSQTAPEPEEPAKNETA